MHEFTGGFYHFDSLPADGRIVRGHRLRGWILTKQHQPFVDVRIRCAAGKLVTIYGLPRPDLAQVFNARRPFIPAEFESSVDLPPGEKVLQLEALAVSGEWREVTSISVTVVPAETDSATFPPGSASSTEPPLRAHEFSRALRVLLSSSPEHPFAPANLAQATPWPPAVRHPHQPFHGFLDEPAALSRSDFGRVHVSGWLFHESASIRAVVASFDLIGFEPLTLGGAFPGVAERFPSFAGAAHCRVHGVVDAPSQLAAHACLRVFAEIADGAWHLCHVQRSFLIDHEQEKRAPGASSALSFLRTARQLRRAYAAISTPVETGAAARAGLWKTWRNLPQRAPATQRKLAPAKRNSPSGTGVDPRRILLVTHNLALEGASLFLLEYAAQWRRRGVAIAVVSGSDGPLRARYETLQAEIQIVDLAGLSRASDANALRKEIAAVSEKIAWKEFDLVVVNTIASYWAIHAATAAGRPSIFYIHESTTPARFYLGRLAPAVVPVVEEAFGLATHVSFLAEATRRYYAAFYRHNTSINPGWLDLPALDAARQHAPTSSIRSTIGLREGQRLVVNIGTVCDRKGQTLFARMVELLWQTAPEIAAQYQFIIVGARHSLYDASLQALAHDLARTNLHIVPETADAYRWYAAAEVFVCSSFEESFPRVILEAMGFGLGIVSTDVHAISEIVRHAQEALLFPAGNTAAGAAALRRILADDSLRRRLGAAGRARVEASYTLETVFPRHQSLAREVLQG
jgi:glycosyltransferase involved in cell wall biosynthesis